MNALGSIVDRQGQIVRCSHPTESGCGTIAERIAQQTALATSAGASEAAGAGPGLTQNATLTLVVTNQKLPFWALQRLAVQVHTSMARAIQPFSTVSDGDALYAVTTGDIENPDLTPRNLGVIAGELAWDAVLSSVPPREPRRDLAPVEAGPGVLDAYAGDYWFSRHARATVRLEQGRLRIDPPEQGSLYLPAGVAVDLIPLSVTEFGLGTDREDWRRFERAPDGEVIGLVINPGPWPIPATRIR